MVKNKYITKKVNGIKKRLHRHIMEEHLGRPLLPNEHVYHLNGDSLDNRIENLVVVLKNQQR